MHTRQKIIWTKMSGAGNSFWITYLTPALFPAFVDKDWFQVARELCQKERASGGGDGLVVLVPSQNCDFRWLFYNADGSPAEMCGNAACCVTEYVFKKQRVPAGRSSFTFETTAQEITGEFIQESARIFLKQNKDIQGPFKITFNGEIISYMFINSSVPHAVIKMTNWPEASLEWENPKELARNLRRKTAHHVDGMNVSFCYWPEEKESTVCKNSQPVPASSPPENNIQNIRLFARTFERGVEDFTSACGTGALAVAQIYRRDFPHLDFVLVRMPGGQLKVGFHSDKTISLMSPVKWLKELELSI